MSVHYRALPFDTEMLGIPCGQIELHAPASSSSPTLEAQELMDCAHENHRRGLVLIKIDHQQTTLTAELAHFGARPICQEIEYHHTQPRPASPEARQICLAPTWDPTPLLPLAQELAHSRLLLDERIPQAKARKLWRHSITNHCTGRAHSLAIGFDNDQPSGLIIVNTGAAGGLDLFYVAVARHSRGKGLASLMLQSVLASAQAVQPVTVEALSGNLAARRLYEKNGFTPKTTRQVFHLWLEG